MILRKALLISAPEAGAGSLRGVNAELEATMTFLMSPNGGAWTAEEITILKNPSLKTIIRTVKEMVADYTITYFSGRGFPDKNGNHFLLLNDGDFFQDTELLNESVKQVVLIDDCAENFNGEESQSTASASELDKARRMYDRWIENCEDGQLIMHSTEEATVTPARKKGGLFTKKLLQVASSIPPARDRFNLKSILATGHETPDLLLEEGYEEGPAITYSNGNIKLPFAMALPAPISLLPAIKKDDFSSGLTLGLFFLAFFLSLE
jgi:hypothetical protein